VDASGGCSVIATLLQPQLPVLTSVHPTEVVGCLTWPAAEAFKADKIFWEVGVGRMCALPACAGRLAQLSLHKWSVK
jgi:hypothetical protein